MADTNPQASQSQVEPTETVDVQAGEANPFDETSWAESPAGEDKEEEIDGAELAKVDPPAGETKPTDEVLDANDFLKKELGYDSLDAAKKELQELRELKEKAKTPEEIKFANDASKRFFEALQEGKEDDLYTFLDAKRKLSQAQNLDITKADDAAKILKLDLQYKHKDLTAEEVEFIFNRDYKVPTKPVQKDDQTDEEYAETLSLHEQRVKEIQQSMIIDAKMAKPRLSQYSSEIILPDIPKSAPTAKQPTAEELQQFEKQRDAYFQEVTKGLQSVKGFTTEYKDEAVTIPISYEITNEEKTAIKPIMESLSSSWEYFEKRWSNPDNTINTTLMAEDLYILENKGKVFQKFANEAGSQRLVHKIKDDSNIDLDDGVRRPTVPLGVDTTKEFYEEAWR